MEEEQRFPTAWSFTPGTSQQGDHTASSPRAEWKAPAMPRWHRWLHMPGMCHQVSWRLSHSSHSHLPPCQTPLQPYPWGSKVRSSSEPRLPQHLSRSSPQSRTLLEKSAQCMETRQPQPEGLPLLVSYVSLRSSSPCTPVYLRRNSTFTD